MLGFNGTVNKLMNWTAQVDPAISAGKMLDGHGGGNINKDLMIEFFNVNSNKVALIDKIDRIKDFYFTHLIIDRVIDDSINPNGNSSNLYSMSVKNENGQQDEAATKLIEDFNAKFDINKMVTDIAGDLLLYGEHYIRLSTMNYGEVESGTDKGIVNLHDDVDISKIVPVFRDGDIAYYITNEGGTLVDKSPAEYAYFSMPASRIKVQVDALDDKIMHFRMGRPIIYGALGLLDELKLLETMMPISFINSALKTRLVSIGVPSQTKPQDAMAIAKTYETMINKTLKIDSSGKTNEEIIKTISSRVGQVKVIPDFGDKGQLEAQDIDTDSNNDELTDKINDLRKMTLTTIGIPAGIMDEEALKADVIKDHIRYSKKLKSVHKALTEGIKHIFVVHLHNSGYNTVIKDDIDIKFLNVLDTDDLEKLEYLDVLVSMMDNFKSYVSDFEDNENIDINYEQYYEFMNEYLGSVTGFQLFTPKETGDENEV